MGRRLHVRKSDPYYWKVMFVLNGVSLAMMTWVLSDSIPRGDASSSALAGGFIAIVSMALARDFGSWLHERSVRQALERAGLGEHDDFGAPPSLDPVDDITEGFKKFLAVPAPKLDRVLVHDKDILETIPLAPVPSPLEPFANAMLLGVPVLVDPNVPPGCIEAWLDGRLVKRYRLGDDET